MIEITKKNIRVWSMLGMRRILGPAMKDIIEQDRKVLFATADTGRYYAYDDLLRTYPENVVDVGIAEQNLIGASAGLQNEDFNVYAVTYATFLTSRALDQIRVNLGYMGLGVKLIGEAGGMCDGNFSATHMALEDVSNTRNIPNMRVIIPADGMELVKTLVALKDADYPAYVRMTGRFPIPVIYREDYDFEIGKAVTLREGKDIAILSNGTLLGDVLKTAEMLADALRRHPIPQSPGIRRSVENLRTGRRIHDKQDYGSPLKQRFSRRFGTKCRRKALRSEAESNYDAKDKKL